MTLKRLSSIILLMLTLSLSVSGQSQLTERINELGKFDRWKVCEIKESGIIGGATKYIYKLDRGDTLRGNIPYKAPKGTFWATTNVMANIIGIIKSSNSVFYEKRGDGYCARLEIVLERVRVIGMIDISVVAQGSIILGELHEPIRDVKSPYSKVDYGIAYTERPRGLQFDYKAKVGNPIIRATGLTPKRELGGHDYSDIVVLLQHRWEDEDGNIFSKRVGTGYKRITEDVMEWHNGEIVEIKYGDISQNEDFKEYMGLRSGDIANFAINSKGRSKPIQEIGWASPDESPTHLIIWLSASNGIAFFGGVGNILWIDNVKLLF